MTVDDVKSEIDELCSVDISPAMISKITDKVFGMALDMNAYKDIT